MKLALIPPIPHLKDFKSSGVSMCLAPLAQKHPEYTQYYSDRSSEGGFVILDNGAHEGETVKVEQLFHIAAQIGASEVVVPDTLYSSGETLIQLQMTLTWLKSEGFEIYQRAGYPRLMVVPHVMPGEGIANSYAISLGRMLRLCQLNDWPFEKLTFGIPFRYDTAPEGDLYSILDRVTWLLDDTGCEIHLLGWSKKPDTPLAIAADFPSIRSVDTAKPFTLARAGYRVSDLFFEPQWSSLRQEDYFTRRLSTKEMDSAQYNVETFSRDLDLASSVSKLPERYSSTVLKERREKANRNRPRLSNETGSDEGIAPTRRHREANQSDSEATESTAE